jgi:hypothetical protein
MYRFAVVLAVVASAAVVVSAAFADPPTRSPTGNGPFTLSGLCSFDVQVTPLVDKEYTITFSDGATIITGRLVERLTNATTGKSLVVNISGPGFVNPDGTELVLTGTSLLFGFTSPHGLFLTHGLDTIDLTTSNFVITSAATVDLCAALS